MLARKVGSRAYEPVGVLDEPVGVLDEPVNVLDEPVNVLDEPVNVLTSRDREGAVLDEMTAENTA